MLRIDSAAGGDLSTGCAAGRMKVTTASPDPKAEWWTTSDVAAYLGVQIGTVSSYRLRGQMPEPDMTVGRTHGWRPRRIVAWHNSRPRPGGGGVPRAAAA